MLIDGFMPSFDVIERHNILVTAPAERAYAAVRGLDLSRSQAVRALFAVRGIPLLIRRWPRNRRTMTLDDLVSGGFVLLADEPPKEIVLGVVGRFWKPSGGVQRVDPADFAALHQPGTAKAAWNFRVESVSDGTSVLLTETRVLCAEEATRRKFLLYWAAIGPFSGLIRRQALRLVKADAERAAA